MLFLSRQEQQRLNTSTHTTHYTHTYLCPHLGTLREPDWTGHSWQPPWAPAGNSQTDLEDLLPFVLLCAWHALFLWRRGPIPLPTSLCLSSSISSLHPLGEARQEGGYRAQQASGRQGLPACNIKLFTATSFIQAAAGSRQQDSVCRPIGHSARHLHCACPGQAPSLGGGGGQGSQNTGLARREGRRGGEEAGAWPPAWPARTCLALLLPCGGFHRGLSFLIQFPALFLFHGNTLLAPFPKTSKSLPLLYHFRHHSVWEGGGDF